MAAATAAASGLAGGRSGHVHTPTNRRHILVMRMRGGWNHQGQGLNSDRPSVVGGDRNAGDGVVSAAGGFLDGDTLHSRSGSMIEN